MNSGHSFIPGHANITSAPENKKSSLTLSETALVGRLTPLKDGLDKDAHAALGGVPATHHAESQALLARALLELDRQQAEGGGRGAGCPPLEGH